LLNPDYRLQKKNVRGIKKITLWHVNQVGIFKKLEEECYVMDGSSRLGKPGTRGFSEPL